MDYIEVALTVTGESTYVRKYAPGSMSQGEMVLDLWNLADRPSKFSVSIDVTTD